MHVQFDFEANTTIVIPDSIFEVDFLTNFVGEGVVQCEAVRSGEGLVEYLTLKSEKPIAKSEEGEITPEEIDKLYEELEDEYRNV